MDFKQAFPEATAARPQLPGQPISELTPLDRMRRQQLHDLARAYEIAVPADGTKPQIMPALKAAQSEGIFNKSALHPEFLAKAARNADDPPSDAWMDYIPKAVSNTIKDVRALCKENDINSFQMSEDEMRSALHEKGAL